VALVYKKAEEELKLVKWLIRGLVGRLVESEAASAEGEVAEAAEFAEEQVAEAVGPAELAVRVETPVDNLAVENSTATAVHNLVAELAVEVETLVDSLVVESSTATVVHNLVGG
jgi:hypothetical protein